MIMMIKIMFMATIIMWLLVELKIMQRLRVKLFVDCGLVLQLVRVARRGNRQRLNMGHWDFQYPTTGWGYIIVTIKVT